MNPTTTKQNTTTNAAGHTPGPWKVEEYNSENVRGAEAIVSSVGFIVHPEMGVVGTSESTAEANARLIASAPALVDALEAAANRLSSAADAFDKAGNEWMAGIYCKHANEARAAIARATLTTPQPSIQ